MQKTLENRISSYYKYWNDFVHIWENDRSIINSRTSFEDWTSPNDVCLLNNIDDPSFNYLPEPWWGNDGKDDLQAVVINYNPGQGGENQTRTSYKRLQSDKNHGFIDYSDFVKLEVSSVNRILKGTHKFHYNKRAQIIFNAINEFNESLGEITLRNFLSIELIPWHTPGVDNYVFTYLYANLQTVFEHSILFAVDQSKTIKNNILKNVVILRISGDITAQLLERLKQKEIISNYSIKEWEIPDPKSESKKKFFLYPQDDNYQIRCMIFNIDHIECHGISFVSIWGTTTHNDFPKQEYVNLIFQKINEKLH